MDTFDHLFMKRTVPLNNLKDLSIFQKQFPYTFYEMFLGGKEDEDHIAMLNEAAIIREVLRNEPFLPDPQEHSPLPNNFQRHPDIRRPPQEQEIKSPDDNQTIR